MQTQLTNSQVQVQIAENQGEADLARARKQAEQTVVTAEAENQKRILQADAELARSSGRRSKRWCSPRPRASSAVLAGRGEAPNGHAGRPVRGGGVDAEDRLVRRSAAVRPVAWSAEHLSHSSSRWCRSGCS